MKEICRITLERAYLFLDGEVLDDSERLEIKSHLEACRPCYERYGLEQEITIVIQRLQGCVPCPDALRNKVQNLIREA